MGIIISGSKYRVTHTKGYEAFGNIQKSGNSSLQPTYAGASGPPSNQYSTIGSSTPTYDNNGDVTNDFTPTFAFDANGNPVTIDTVSVTYDAHGRMVEQNRSCPYQKLGTD